MRAASPCSLYVHTPFCRARCRYCAFYSAPVGRHGPPAELLERFLYALGLEMDQLARRHGPLLAPSLFFGGGTPSLLGADALGRILELLRTRFPLAPDAEVTLEANPDSASPEFLRAAHGLGVTRLSLGVQSLDDASLRALGRVHDAGQAVAAFKAARRAGFANIGLDLIFGLPGQGVDGWLATLRQALALGPEHLSCYGLSIEPGTPLARDTAACAALPDEDRQAEMFLRGSELLESAGFEHYEISNFARPGKGCRHNRLCWEGGDVLGFGPAAVSTRSAGPGALRWANAQDFAAWEELVLAGRAGEHGREELSRETRAREGLMLALRTSRGLDLARHAARGGQDIRATHAGLLAQLQGAGLVTLTPERLTLTRAGMLVSNGIIRALGFE